jgi:hypothetical protein
MLLREMLEGGKHLDPDVTGKPIRVLATVQRIIERGVREGTLRDVDPLLTHLSLVGGLVFFFATASFRARLRAKRAQGIAAPEASAYVRHVQDLITHGLVARGGGAASHGRKLRRRIAGAERGTPQRRQRA